MASVTGFGVTPMATITASGTIVADAGSSVTLVVTATPSGGGSAIPVGTVGGPGPFSLTQTVPGDASYTVNYTLTEQIVGSSTVAV